MNAYACMFDDEREGLKSTIVRAGTKQAAAEQFLSGLEMQPGDVVRVAVSMTDHAWEVFVVTCIG